MQFSSRILLVIVATGATACVGQGPSDDESVRSVEPEWSSGSCGTTSANITFLGQIDPAHFSPETYNRCTKSYIVDLRVLSAAYTGPGDGGGPAAHLQVSFGGGPPGTRAACEDLEGGAIFYKRVGNQWIDQTGQMYSTGTWFQGGGLALCFPPAAAFFDIAAGESYRIAATMRNISNGNPTRTIAISTEPETVIR
jgi:hypothetical protein